jgi:transcriptional regulator of arginine metabolism
MADGGRVVKAVRQRRIADLIRKNDISSQAELAALLKRTGERVTQATLSRDLEELGASKMRLHDGRTVYRVPDDPAESNGDWLRRMLREFAVDVSSSGNLVVVRTPPGGASAVARALDAAALRDVLGTVAGDDTILVIAREGSSGAKLARTLRALIGSHIKEA